MASLPRVVTVDPKNNIPQQIRAAFDLMDRLVVQIDVPGADEALDEVKRGGCDVVIAAWDLGVHTKGWELAGRIRQVDENVSIMVLGEDDDTEMDEEMLEQSPFVYLRRPFDIPQLIRVLKAALDGGNIFEAVHPPASVVRSVEDMGPVPGINQERATAVLEGLQTDLQALALLLADREGHIVAEQGTLMDINREELTHTVLSAVLTTLDLRDIIGGNAAALQFFDGDQYDVFLLSVGLHHFLCIVYEGTRGSRELGAVNRYGRRAAEDLIGVLGAQAWLIQRVQREEPKVVRKSQARKAQEEEEELPQLEPAQLSTSELQQIEEREEEVRLEAIADDAFDPDALFSDDFDENAADDLFSMDALEDLAKFDGPKGTIDGEQAEQLGLLK
jgi:DNA-binding response OmpR family regulator